MSQNKNTNGMTADMDFSVLDGELARMAAETPAVPADFHAAWVKAVKEDAAARTEEKSTSNKKESGRKQWRYLVSAAAVFVLVIGGVLLTRNQKGNPVEEKTSGTVTVQQESEVKPDAVAGQEARKAEDTAEYEESYEAMYDMAAMEESVSYEVEVPEESMMMAASDSFRTDEDGAEAEEAEESEEAPAGGFFKTASQAITTDAGAAAAGEMTAVESLAAGDVTSDEQETEEPPQAAEDAAAEEKTEETAEESHSGLQKIWNGILSATPWILGGVIVLLFVASVILHFGKKKN